MVDRSRGLLAVAAVYMAVVGIGLIVAPVAFAAGAVPADASDALVAFLRVWGSPLLGIALLDWLVRDAAPSPERRAVLLGNLVGFGGIALLDVWGTLSGGRPVMLVFAVVHGLFAAAFLVGWSRRGRTADT